MQKLNDKSPSVKGHIGWYRHYFLHSDIFSIFYNIHDNGDFHPLFPYSRDRKATSFTSTTLTWIKKSRLISRTIRQFYNIATNSMFSMILGGEIHANFHVFLATCRILKCHKNT